MKKTSLLILMLSLFMGILFAPANRLMAALEDSSEESEPPYSANKCLLRGEELFRKNNYGEALIFYYEAMPLVEDKKTLGKLHFRIGECLEAVRRFEFATWHYQQAMKTPLPDILVSRVIMKLEHLPEMAQKEEATRLFDSAMELYKKRNIRQAIDDYLSSLRLMPSLMAKDETGLIDDAVNYLTYLSESRENEPDRLLKLGTLLELRGDIDKAVETFQQIIIIYPETDEARQAETKLENFKDGRTVYTEPEQAKDALKPFREDSSQELLNEVFEFRKTGVVSRSQDNFAFTLRAENENINIPEGRFENFSIILGEGSDLREFNFYSEDGIEQKTYIFETAHVKYEITFLTINTVRGYVQDVYGKQKRSVNLFSEIRLKLKIASQPY
ncbi:MAG: tetratricopeptide repeat protein [Candidatus Rifleibacteriota bacterium]